MSVLPGGSDTASNPLVCPECGSASWGVVDEDTEECNCDDCGYDFNLLAALPLWEFVEEGMRDA